MNPDELWIGKALFVGLVGLTIWGITALLQAKGEGARRVRLALGWAIGLAVAWAWFMMVGPIGFTTTLVFAGVTTWIIKGFRK